MPILNIEVVGQTAASFGPDLASRLADTAGSILGSRPRGTWVKLRFLADTEYAENQGDPAAPRPVIVTLLQAKLPGREELERQLEELARGIASLLGREMDNVHIIAEPAGLGRVAFGGKLLS